MEYRIVLKDESGKLYFYEESYLTKAEAEAQSEILQEEGENVHTIIESVR